MRQLLLLRHAKSSWDDRDVSDHARPLNPRGRRAASAVRAAMARLGLAPTLILVSSARRTAQTVEALEPWDASPRIDTLDSLYLASASTLLRTLQDLQDTVRSVLLVGHNPGVHELAIRLVGDRPLSSGDDDWGRLAEGYPSGALAEFTVAGPWHALNEGGADLVRFIRPRDLPET